MQTKGSHTKKKVSQSWDIVPTSADPPLAELGTPYLVKNIIAYFNSTASETNFKYYL